MNKKRFRKLAKKAGFVLWGTESHKPEGSIIDWSSDYDKELQAFARLIVQECIDVIQRQVIMKFDNNFVDDDFNVGYRRGAEVSGERIKQHFET